MPKPSNKRAQTKLNATTVCPAISAAVTPLLAQAFPDVALVAVTLEDDPATQRPMVDIAVELTNVGHQEVRLDPTAIANLPKISLETCEAISRHINEAIDALPELANQRYSLNVGSPGAFRRLTTAGECSFYQNWPVSLSLPKEPALSGWLTAVSNTEVTLTQPSGGIHTIALTELPKKAHLALNPTLAMPNDEVASDS